jgi:hypothetical protein
MTQFSLVKLIAGCLAKMSESMDESLFIGAATEIERRFAADHPNGATLPGDLTPYLDEWQRTVGNQ